MDEDEGQRVAELVAQMAQADSVIEVATARGPEVFIEASLKIQEEYPQASKHVVDIALGVQFLAVAAKVAVKAGASEEAFLDSARDWYGHAKESLEEFEAKEASSEEE